MKIGLDHCQRQSCFTPRYAFVARVENIANGILSDHFGYTGSKVPRLSLPMRRGPTMREKLEEMDPALLNKRLNYHYGI